MVRNIYVNKMTTKAVGEQQTEYVERKGLGHPDSLIDGIVDETSHALSREYLDKCGYILHHNVDKGLIIGGASKVGFGHGEITKKIEVIVTGRAADRLENTTIEVNEIATRVATEYLKSNTRFLDLENEVTFESKIARGSADLTNIFQRGKGAVPLANDTSFGIGFAPLTDTERLVLEVENYLNSRDYKNRAPSVGEDVKVMGVREGDKITLTIAIAFVAKLIDSVETYSKVKEGIKEDVHKFASKITDKEVVVYINYGDSEENEDVYLTKSGLSCEAGDDGSVGRGNRVNGLITPFRPMSLEAAAGKNPVNHIGKIYNILAKQLSSDIVKECPEVKACNIAILSQIGRPIDQPHNLNIDIINEEGSDFSVVNEKARRVADSWLDGITDLTMDILLGKYKAF